MRASSPGVRFATALFCGLLVAGCGSAGSGIGPSRTAEVRQTEHRAVAAVGNDEAETRLSIQAATRAGKVARYVTISHGSAAHVFSPYAQILRTASTIVARGYDRMYVWRSDGTTVVYSSAKEDIKGDLPVVPAPKLDRLAARPHRTAFTTLGKSLCEDCLLLLGAPRTRRHADGWSALKDPWQLAPDYTYWNPGITIASAPSHRHTSADNICEVTPIDDNNTYIGGCTYYYYDYVPYQAPYAGPPAGGGGGGGGGGSAPAPCPPTGGPPDLNSAIQGDNFAQAVAQAVANNYGGKPTQINVKSSVPDAHEAAEAHSVDSRDSAGNAISRNSIDWSTSGVSGAVANGQAENQIFTHEELHLWYETLNATDSLRPNPVPGEPGFQSTRSVTLDDGTILNFNISATNFVLNDAYTGFEHVLIHDQLVSNYGSDQTGAIGEAFAQATSFQFKGQPVQSIPPLANGRPDYASGFKIASDHKESTARVTSGGIVKKPPTTPDPNAGCTGAGTSSRARQPGGRAGRHGAAIQENVGGYIVIWDGARF